MRTRSDSKIPPPPDPFPQIPAWRYGPEIYDYRLSPSELPPLDPRIQPEPVVPRIPNPPPDVNPFGTPPRNLPPGPAPSAPPIVPNRHYYEPPLPNSPNPFDPHTPPPQSENFYSPGQPAPAVQNLTAHVLRMKGVPEAVIGAAINDPTQMRGFLNQLYGRRSMVASDAGGGFGGQIGAETLDDQPGQAPTPSAATPDSYLPFGWAGLPALRR